MDNTGWMLGESIALELDAALSFTGGCLLPGKLPEELAGLLRSLPPDWQRQRPALLGVEKGRFISLLEILAFLAGTILDGDYSRATLAMRETTTETALARMTDLLGRNDMGLTDLIMAAKETAYASIGLTLQPS